MRRCAWVLAVWLCALAAPAWAEHRIALVIGNDRYDELSDAEQLHNAVNDARAVKAALEQLHFDVDLGENLDRKPFIEKLSEFGERLQKDDIAFFFFAGHGVALSGANYMLPSDIPRPRANARGEESRLADLAVGETNIIARIRDSGARLAVVVLDACRDNPLSPTGGRSVGGERGLQPPPLTRGVLTIYSAGVGQKATDLGDGNSLFTGILVKTLTTKGLGLRDIAFRTQSEVAAVASRQGYTQEPGVYSQIIGDDVFLAGPADAAASSSAAPAAGDMLAKVIDAASPEALGALIAGLPDGAMKDRALARAAALKAQASLAPTVSPSPPKPLETPKPPETPKPAETLAKPEPPNGEKEWTARINAATSPQTLAPIIAALPDGPLKELAKARAETLKGKIARLTLEQPKPPRPAPAPIPARRPRASEPATPAAPSKRETIAARPVHRAESAPPRQPAAKPDNCFSFNGERYCN